MAGAIGDLLNSSVPRRTVIVRVLERQEELYRELLLMPQIENARIAGDEIGLDVDGTEDACCDLLATLIQRGYRILEFKLQRANLEEVFMNVTKGVVQ
jgi:ABC-2 type transport system ATP-binding protein